MEELTNKKFGNLGERKVAEWGDRSGMTVTEPGEDERGWDLLLEFDLRDDESATADEPLDKDSRLFRALVQVKTKSRTPGRCQIKLSNLSSLVEHGGPSYVVVLEMDSKYPDAEVGTAYVVHIGRDIISDVLKKKRELEYGRLQEKSDGQNPSPIQLNKHTLSVVYDKHSLSEPSSYAFRETLVEPLQGSPRFYFEWKTNIYKNVGYDQQTGMAVATGEFSIRLPEEYQDSPEDYFVDAAFGKVAPMEIAGGEVREHRFDIPSAPATIPESILEVGLPTRKVEAKFERPGLGNRITSDGKLQLVSIPHSEGGQYEAANLSVAHTDLTYRDKGDLLEVNFGFDIEPGEYRLNELLKTAELASFMTEAGENEEDVRVEIKSQANGNWDSLPTLEISESAAFEELQSEGVKRFISSTRNANQLVDDLGIHRQLEVSVGQLHKYRTALQTYSEFSRVQGGQSTNEGLFMGFEKEPESSEEFLEEGAEVCFVDLISLRLGKQLIVISFGLSGQVSSLRVRDEDTPEERHRKESATAQLPDHTEGYELSIEEIFYLQPYSFERGEDTPEKDIFLKDPFEKAISNCQSILSLTQDGQLTLYAVE